MEIYVKSLYIKVYLYFIITESFFNNNYGNICKKFIY